MVRPSKPNDESIPMSPKQWSPCIWLMNTAQRRLKPIFERRICSCVPSTQSTRNCFSRISTTCAEGLWRNVGSALPQPSICILKGSIVYTISTCFSYFFRLRAEIFLSFKERSLLLSLECKDSVCVLQIERVGAQTIDGERVAVEQQTAVENLP